MFGALLLSALLSFQAQEEPVAPAPEPESMELVSPESKEPDNVRPSTGEERLVIVEMSRVRLHPREYAKWLRTQVKYFEGTLWRLPDHVPIRTNEGVEPLQELIEFLESTPSPGPLRWNEGLSRAARELVREQGPTTQTGHVGPTGSRMRDRILKHGLHESQIAEVINYGDEKPRWTVMQLLIDDGVPARSHRKAIFGADYHVAGAAIGLHAGYGTMTVVDMADAYKSNPGVPEK
jgi:uncharacterized protein YkwD